MYPIKLRSFWKNNSSPMINLYWVRFPCNHSLCTGSTVVGQCMEQRSGVPNGYALIAGFLRYKLLPVICLAGYCHSILFPTKLVTLRARFAHVKSFLRFYRRIVQTTATDGGSVDFASLHGCNLLGQRICPWMDGSRAMQEQLPRSYCRGASHRPDSLIFLQQLRSYEISGLGM